MGIAIWRARTTAMYSFPPESVNLSLFLSATETEREKVTRLREEAERGSGQTAVPAAFM